jgi:hypothetical protein
MLSAVEAEQSPTCDTVGADVRIWSDLGLSIGDRRQYKSHAGEFHILPSIISCQPWQTRSWPK